MNEDGRNAFYNNRYNGAASGVGIGRNDLSRRAIHDSELLFSGGYSRSSRVDSDISSISYYSQISDSPFNKGGSTMLSQSPSSLFDASSMGLSAVTPFRKRSVNKRSGSPQNKRFQDITVGNHGVEHRTFITVNGHLDFDAVSHSLPPSIVPSPEKLQEGREMMKAENNKWERAKYRMKATRKAHKIYSKMVEALNTLNTHAEQKDIETADAVEVLGDFVATDEVVELGKMIENSKTKVEDLLQTHGEITQNRQTLLRDLKKWFEHSNEAADFEDIDLLPDELLDQPMKNLGEMVDHLKLSSNRLSGMQNYVVELRNIISLIKSKEILPASVIKQSLIPLEETIEKLNQELKEATTRSVESEAKIKVLEDELKEYRSTNNQEGKNREKLRKMYAQVKAHAETKERNYESKISSMKQVIESMTKTSNNTSDQTDRKHLSQYFNYMRTEMRNKDKEIEEQAQRIKLLNTVVETLQEQLDQKNEEEEKRQQKNLEEASIDISTPVEPPSPIVVTQSYDMRARRPSFKPTTTTETQTDNVIIFAAHRPVTKKENEGGDDQSTTDDWSGGESEQETEQQDEAPNKTGQVHEETSTNKDEQQQQQQQESQNNQQVDSTDVDKELSEQFERHEETYQHDVKEEEAVPPDASAGIERQDQKDLTEQTVEQQKDGTETNSKTKELPFNISEYIDEIIGGDDQVELSDSESHREFKFEYEEQPPKSVVTQQPKPVVRNRTKTKLPVQKQESNKVTKLSQEPQQQSDDKPAPPSKVVTTKQKFPPSNIYRLSDNPYEAPEEPKVVTDKKRRKTDKRIANDKRDPVADRKEKKQDKRVKEKPIPVKVQEKKEPKQVVRTKQNIEKPVETEDKQEEPPVTDSGDDNDDLTDNYFNGSEHATEPSVENEDDQQVTMSKEILSGLEKRARQYVEMEYKEEIKNLMSEVQSYKQAHGFLNNKIEMYLKELPHLYPINIVEQSDKDEEDLKFQFENHFLNSGGTNSVIWCELVLDCSLRLATLYTSMKSFIDDIFDKNATKEDNIREKFYEMKVAEERQKAEKILTRMTQFGDSNADVTAQNHASLLSRKRTTEQLMINNKLLREAKIGAMFRKLSEHLLLVQMEASTFALQRSGISPTVISFMRKREKRQRELVTLWENKRQALHCQIVRNIDRILKLLDSIIYLNSFWQSPSPPPAPPSAQKQVSPTTQSPSRSISVTAFRASGPPPPHAHALQRRSKSSLANYHIGLPRI